VFGGFPAGTGTTGRTGRDLARLASSRGAPARRRPPRGGWGEERNQSVAVLTVSWCCSVGSTWALLLREDYRRGPSVWISSGVPITEPAPDSLAHELLAQHGFRLFCDPDNSPRSRSRRKLGFVSRDAELILLAETIRAEPTEHLEHPLALAERWIAAGFPTLAALNWVRAGVLAPEAVHRSSAGIASALLPPSSTPGLSVPRSTAVVSNSATRG
jgi:hypothetical protein